jgi:hypothetical protein
MCMTKTKNNKNSHVVFLHTFACYQKKDESDADDNAIMGQMWRVGLRVEG